MVPPNGSANGGRPRCYSVDAGALNSQGTGLWNAEKPEDALKSLPSFPLPGVEPQYQNLRECTPIPSPSSTPAITFLGPQSYLPRRAPSFASQGHLSALNHVAEPQGRPKRSSHMWAVAIDMELPELSEPPTRSSLKTLGDDFQAPSWVPTWARASFVLAVYTVPKEVYWAVLLRIPPLYHSRVQRLLRDVNMGRDDIEAMVMEAMEMEQGLGSGESDKMFMLEQGMLSRELVDAQKTGMPPPPLAYINLRDSWKTFLDSLIREWKTLNMISVLLLSAVLPFQIGDSSSSAITRHCALASSVCAFMSLTYGCIYIIRFGMMRKTYKAAEWTCELPKQVFWIFWNVWIMLALPAIWLGWSMIIYMACIMSYVWIPDAMPIEDAAFNDSVRHNGIHYILPRIAVTAILCLGVVYLVLVGFTFRRYDEPMDRAWQERVRRWMKRDGNEKRPPRRQNRSVDSGATLY